MIGRDVNSIEDDALEGLVNYSWPGNVRELINVIERAVLLCESGVIGAADLPDQIAESKVPAIPSRPDSDLFPVQLLDQPIREARQVLVSEFEKAYLTRLLELTNGRVGETARRAGIEPRSLFEKMRRYGLRKEDFRRRDR
jgi:DNA-binding NtrC family response regulator